MMGRGGGQRGQVLRGLDLGHSLGMPGAQGLGRVVLEAGARAWGAQGRV